MAHRPRRIVVVGGGIAGLTACDTLRAEGFDGELTVIGAESRPAYSRPALSKAVLRLADDPGAPVSAHELPPTTHGATELRGVSAIGLDPDRRSIALDDGSALHYDGLVIATGSRARRLTGSVHERTLRDLDDAIGLRSALAGIPRVAVVGGGVLGMEIASGAAAAGCAVTVVATSAPMSRQLGTYLAGTVGRAAEARGVTVVLAGKPRVTAHENGVRAEADGRTIDADVVITAVGDVPNVDWLGASGLLRDGALHADDQGRVRPDIVAAGDVVTWRGRRRLALWTSAIEQAKVAASALLRGKEAATPSFQPYFWTEQFGLHLKAVGDLPVHGDPEILEGDEESALLRWERGDGSRTAISVNYRIPIPRLRRLASAEHSA